MRELSRVGDRRYPLALALLSAVTLLGCGSDGVTSYELSGTVTYNGKPVPRGNITLSPDSSKGNEGPGAIAEIMDGKFKTQEGKGVVGGPYVLLVSGYDGVPVQGGEGIIETGTALFQPYELKEDLPKKNSQLEIKVPAK